MLLIPVQCRRRPLVSLVLLAGLVLAACSGGGELPRQTSAKPMREYERDFDPAAYRPADPDTAVTPPASSPVSPGSDEEWTERKERVMGFRVQLHSTTNLDEAQSALADYRSRLDSLRIDAGRLDMVFDAPYYKIRIGDFLVRKEADTLTGKLREAGIPQAWVVRDNVVRIIRERKQR